MLCAGIDVSKPHLDLALVSSTAKPTRLFWGPTPKETPRPQHPPTPPRPPHLSCSWAVWTCILPSEGGPTALTLGPPRPRF
jgi:hypothetical protein